MKKRVQERGEYDWSAEDLIELQSQPFELIEKIYNQFGDIVISGCAVTGNRIESGVVCLGGVAMPFDGAEGVVFPRYLVTEKRAVTGRYVDGLEKPISYDYRAVISGVRPDGESFVTVQSTGIEKLLKLSSDAVDSDSSNTVATSKAVSTLNKKITELTPPKSDRIDLEDSNTLATSMAVATLNKKIKPLAQATETVLGGIKAKPRTTETLEVAIDTESGKLFADSVIDDLPVNTILQTTTLSENIFGEKWLECNGALIEREDYIDLNVKVEDYSSWTRLYGSFNSVIYRNGLFVAVGEGGACYTSLDGIKWASSSGLSGSLKSITCGNGLFAVAGGSVYTSLDGVSWAPMDGTSGVFSITYGNGLFVAVGGNGACRTSPDGITWDFNSGLSGALNGVTYGNGLFVIVTGSKLYYTSSDGVVWTSRNCPSVMSYITYLNGLFITDTCNISTDGINWSINNLTGVKTVTYGNGLFIAAGDNVCYTSTNAIDWISGTGIKGSLNSITYGNKLFIAVGQGVYHNSADGIIWDSISGTPYGRIVYGNGVFVSVRYSLGCHVSLDGKNWTNIKGINGRPTDVTYGNGLFIIVGYKSAVMDDGSICYTSVDGVNWTPINRVIKAVTGVIYGDGIYVIAGPNCYTSQNGVDWIERNKMEKHTNTFVSDAIYANGLFIFCMKNPECHYISSDGINWTLKSESFEIITFGKGLFVGAIDGVCFTSEDGINWIQRGSLSGATAIAYGDGLFLAMGNGICYTSTDGISWNSYNGITKSITRIMCIDGLFIITTDVGCYYLKFTEYGILPRLYLNDNIQFYIKALK